MPRQSITTAVEGKSLNRRTGKKPVKLNEARTAVEIQHKKNLAVILKVATYSHSQIARTLGERVSTIREWFKDEKVQKQYEETLHVISGAAKEYMETLTVEAVKRLGELMRQQNDPRLALDAAKEILDRGGLPKISRNEKKEEKEVHGDPARPITHEHKHAFHRPGDADHINQVIADAERLTSEAS